MKQYSILLVLILGTITLKAQDTLAGNYTNLKISAGKHIVKSTVTVKGLLEILPDAKIEFQENGIIVCEGGVVSNGVKNNIEFYGLEKSEGIGFVIKNVDSSSVIINNTVFRNLQFPLFFDFGWKRKEVFIMNNQFVDNIGKTSVIQVLNPPFNLSVDSNYVDFKLQGNIFSNNNASIYMEDLKNDQIQFELSNNIFIGNMVYGFKNYNISTNIVYGRVDQVFSKYTAKIENNSFAYNYLIDNLTDTVVHAANFGIYGTDKSFPLVNNYLGSNKKDNILKGLYDQTLNYNAPKIEFEPFLNKPATSLPGHVYQLLNLDKSEFVDSLPITESLKGLIFQSNKELDFSKSNLMFTYFLDDSSLKKKDTLVIYDQKPNGDENQVTFSKRLSPNNKLGYLTVSNIKDIQGNYVPTIRIGWLKYLVDLKRRKVLADLLKEKKTEDSLKRPPPPVDSIKNTFQKIEAPLKSRLEFGLYTGGAIFNGTISQSSLFNNDINLFNGLLVNYTIFSNLSASIVISNFKLSNSDRNSNNNEQQARGMSFTTSMTGMSAAVNYDLVDNRLYTKAKRLRPSVGFGLDVFSFAPSGMYNGVEYKLQPLGTGGQFADSTGKPYSLMALGYFFNFKMKYQINRFNSVGLHLSIHKSMSDYLDDVGPDIYPSAQKILKSKVENIDAALYFSNPNSRNVTGQFRNSPNGAKDGFINFGIYYSRRLFK